VWSVAVRIDVTRGDCNLYKLQVTIQAFGDDQTRDLRGFVANMKKNNRSRRIETTLA